MKLSRALALPIALLLAFSALPIYLGSPGDASTNSAPAAECRGCHQAPGGEAAVRVIGLPDRYEPGKAYAVTIAVESQLQSQGETQGGFSVSASKGELEVADPTHTQMSAGFLTHTAEGATQRTWRFTWRAPQATGTAELTVAVLAANGDFSPNGDAAATQAFSLEPR